MNKSYPSLSTFLLPNNSSCLHPPELPELIHWDDPALAAMIDFKFTTPITIHQKESIDDALTEMRLCARRELLVVDNDNYIVGIIGAEDILGEKPVKLSQDGRLKRSDIKTNMVMVPQQELACLDITELRYAKVGNIVSTFYALKQHYLLVLQKITANSAAKARGIFSASQISRQLGENITDEPMEAHSIAELQGIL